jgi:hypothetical protein
MTRCLLLSMFSVPNAANVFQVEKQNDQAHTLEALAVPVSAAAAVAVASSSPISAPLPYDSQAATQQAEPAATAAGQSSNSLAAQQHLVTPLPLAMNAASAASMAVLDSTSVHSAHVELLSRMRAISDHILRDDHTPSFDPKFSGQLVTEWQDEATKYQFPISLVWMYDEQSAAKRSSDPQLLGVHKSMPLLPMFTVGVVGDGSCLLQSLLLANAHPDPKGSIPSKEIRDSVLGAQRNPVSGWLLAPSRKAVSDALASFRKRSVRN